LQLYLQQKFFKKDFYSNGKNLPIQGTYEVILSKGPRFQKYSLKKEVTNLNQTVVKDIGQGQYYWKVNLIDKDGQPALSSDSKEVAC
jgi:hypothetical protein